MAPDAPPQKSLKAMAMRGSIWIFIGYGASQVIRMGSNLVLTRLLYPEAFGLMALVNVFIQGLGMFSDVGIVPSIVQNKRGDEPVFLDTAWTIQVIRGLCLSASAAIIAWPVALLYHEPRLLTMLPVVGLTAMISGFNSTAVPLANRHLRMGKLTLMELINQSSTVAVLIILAAVFRHVWPDASVWSLVIGTVAGSLIYTVLSHTFLGRRRHHFRWDPECRKALFHFGRWVFISTVLTFLAGRADSLIFAKMIPLKVLGVYNIALMIAMVVMQVISRIGSSVAFPAFSRVHSQGGSLASVFHKVRLPLMTLGAVATVSLLAVGPAMIRVMYDTRYEGAGWILQILAVVAWLQMLEAINGEALMAVGSPNWVAAGVGGKVLGMVAAIPIGFYIGGFPGAVIGLAVSELLRYAVSAVGVRRLGLKIFGADALMSLAIGASACIAWKLATWSAARLPLHGRIAAATESLIGLTAMALMWLPLGVRVLRMHFGNRRKSAAAPTAGQAD